MKRPIIAFDPGSGYNDAKGRPQGSACGVCIYDPNKDEIVYTAELRASAKEPKWKRVKDISDQIDIIFDIYDKRIGPLEVRTEFFVMRSAGGPILQHIIGALFASMPRTAIFNWIHNISLKRNLTGSGSADKIDIGNALLTRFPKQATIIQGLIDDGAEDALDAIAIAICTEVME